MYKNLRTLIHYIYLHFALASWSRCQTLLPLSNGMVCPNIVCRVAASEVKDVMLAISETRFKTLVNTISTSSKDSPNATRDRRFSWPKVFSWRFAPHWADGFIESKWGWNVMFRVECSFFQVLYRTKAFTEEGQHPIQKELGALKPMCVFEQGVLTQHLAVFNN